MSPEATPEAWPVRLEAEDLKSRPRKPKAGGVPGPTALVRTSLPQRYSNVQRRASSTTVNARRQARSGVVQLHTRVALRSPDDCPDDDALTTTTAPELPRQLCLASPTQFGPWPASSRELARAPSPSPPLSCFSRSHALLWVPHRPSGRNMGELHHRQVRSALLRPPPRHSAPLPGAPLPRLFRPVPLLGTWPPSLALVRWLTLCPS